MKNIIIIGGSSGIGLEIVNQMYTENRIYVFSRSSGQLPQSANIVWKQFDVLSDTLDVSGLPEKLDGLVYCPGTITLKPVRGIREEDILNDFRINALGGFKAMQSALNKLKASKSASAVFFSTVAVAQGMPYHTSISMAKGALEGMVRSLAAELAPSVRVNAIAPSLTDTPLASRLLSSDEKKEASAQRHPLKRTGTPADIASMAVFLLSDSASWITGQIIGVDGGMGAVKL